MIEILLIEDNPGDARLIKELLAEAKYSMFRVHEADRLLAGLQRLAEGGIDVVLLDLTLPDSSGLDSFARVYAAAPSVRHRATAGRRGAARERGEVSRHL